ncbi:hypothetical protein HZS91_00514 [Xanthomonas citri pv. citri]|nr:hypothetical protein HZS91_00514 [Xanthomonas citri pv. citri]
MVCSLAQSGRNDPVRPLVPRVACLAQRNHSRSSTRAERLHCRRICTPRRSHISTASTCEKQRVRSIAGQRQTCRADTGHWRHLHGCNDCKRITAGTVDSGDFYDVEFSPDCGNEGFFAGVAQAIGRAGQDPRCYYVAAIPASTIARCKNNALCKTYGDRQIKQIKRASGESCHPAAPGQYVGNCAQGWVSADALDVFSNGI